ncbi:class I SAM-dependent methyltransferase [Pelovirga terrestris]|uniref:Class I SAM-dependent methyltransferase n=1 Tax=Pelovirga terrestris TaxID=2771352 RepID=A0A8J6QRQ2_9BACT|nr:class I SAM-dependent methyltransferase [Pelovirga terrestris]MBD1401078.1 class I SAM-dependent methyltransferase [Pelovirga terrestris]
MGFYSRFILPKAVHCACNMGQVRRQREKVIPHARGRVLEIGIGTGLNLPYYDTTRVSKVWGLDPEPAMIRMARRVAGSVPFEVDFIGLSGAEIPLEDDSVDTVVVTYTLCSIADILPALLQMRRVLRPGGELLFCEHGEAPDASVRRWQERINPLWKRIGGGCHLNRAIPAEIEAGGFRITNLDSMYISGWRPVSYNFWGVAVSR